ncbi:MAG: DNA polymerase III subunit alpha [Bacteroidota bacterium]
MYLIFDTETTGLPKNYNAPISDLDNWPRLVQLAWQIHDHKGSLISAQNYIVKPEGFTIPFNAKKVHGISTQRAIQEGYPLEKVLIEFEQDLKKTQLVIGHNVDFDINITGAEFLRANVPSQLVKIKKLDTKDSSTNYCAIPGGRGGKYKWPTLTELHQKLFGIPFDDAHDAAYDVAATAKCFFGLIHEQVVKPFDETPYHEIVYEEPELEEANFSRTEEKDDHNQQPDHTAATEIESDFFHLHVHSQFSVLQATSSVKDLVKKAKELNMPSVGLTDHGNMFGSFKFVKEALSIGVKPIVGCEFYVAEERTKLKFTKESPDKRFNQILLAKNKEGYHNLTKLTSYAFIEGNYGIYPRIDKQLIEQYKEGLIALSGGITSEIPNLILNVGEHQAEEALLWWKNLFGGDFYLQLQRHGLDEEDHVNRILIEFGKKHDVKIVAANNVYYSDKKDADAHDILICIKDAEVKSTPKGKGRGKRFGLPNEEFYFKSQDEMKELFKDVPEAIENLQEIDQKIEPYKLERDVLLPAFEIPDGFESEDDYLKHITFRGAKKRYSEITPEIEERLNFELETIRNTGYPGYFLIVQDFTSQARNMGVSVGPGRGSAAGSAVAYCIGITNVDPIKYDLLFERFLNPDRISLPDIDIDFDDEGREKILKYVVDKYGKNQVAQIITYGSMAAKSSIRDSARVMEMPLPEANSIAKMVPERPGTTLDKAFDQVKELKEFSKENSLKGEVLRQAKVLEGSIRNTGIHACGVIITPDDLTKLVPVAVSKDSDLLVTQYDNSVVENAGMLKMDFLGLKTLSIINTAIRNIKNLHKVEIDPDEIPLDDEKTYELYQKGLTNGTFQFESPGMQKHLRNLKPDKFEDLIAMNALYRPGPMEYIPNFISRKHGREEISFDTPEMEEFLAETYGITVYQEQVMLLSQKLAGFTKGMADSLRKGMGKKKKEIIDELKPKFIEGCSKNNIQEKTAEKIWKDWEAFAAYAFNKSHSTCYSVVAFHTAYLKAHYPAEYMAAVLTHNQSNIDKVTFFMEECKALGINVLGPSVNESGVNFTVNKEGQIRFGLGAIKGAGEHAVQSIITEREEKGLYDDYFDFISRVNLRAVNKKTLECLAMAGGFDAFQEYHRKQYLVGSGEEPNLVDLGIKYAQRIIQEKESAQVSLFGGTESEEVNKPRVLPVEPYSDLEKLRIEKDVVGFYISGHPLDQYKFEVRHFCNTNLSELKDLQKVSTKKSIKIGGIVSDFNHRISKNGKPFGTITLEDYDDSFTFFLFSDDYTKFKEYFMQSWFLFIEGTVTFPQWKSEPDFKILKIDLLSEIRDKMCGGVQINFPIEQLSLEVIDNLERLSEENPGKQLIKFIVQDRAENISIEMLSRKYKVELNDKVLSKLEENDSMDFMLMNN